MIAKILLLALFGACQAAHREPWWIQMWFPNVSFTGKYHPSNYKVEKSPLYPDWAQNPNDVWSTAYWMPYKMAYSQYWIDYINNQTEAEKQAALSNGQNDSNGQYGSNGQYDINGQYGNNGQYDNNGQYGSNGQYDNNGQYESNGQFGNNDQSNANSQFGVNGQYQTSGQFEANGGAGGNNQASLNGQMDENSEVSANGQAGEVSQSASTSEIGDLQPEEIAEEASTLAEQVRVQARSMNLEFKQIAVQVAQEAEDKIKVVQKEASDAKEKIENTLLPSNEKEALFAKIEAAAEAKVQQIMEQTAQFEKELASQYENLSEQAKEIAIKASEIAEKTGKFL